MPAVKKPILAARKGYKLNRASNITKHTEKKCRHPFTDGWNSFWHLAFGAWCMRWPWMAPAFVWYQLWDPLERNVWIDIFEFCAGLFVILVSGFGTSSHATAQQVKHAQHQKHI